MSYVQLTTKLIRLDYSIRAIGREINRAPSTISRELRRALGITAINRQSAHTRAIKSARKTVARSRNIPPRP